MIFNEPEFNSRRSPVLATRGMVAASQTQAAAAGVQLLRAGGTAADAAVAAAAVLNVTEPCSTGLGGDCFALYFDAATGNVTALNGSGRAPAALTLELLQAQGFGEALPELHAHTVTVPGACAGWCDLVARHGRQPMSAVLAPAIELAERGFPVAPITAHSWAAGALRQLHRSAAGAELLIDGQAPRAGQVFRNPTLANTLRQIATHGPGAFYHGQIARAIARTVQEDGGMLTEADLAGHSSTWDTPLHTRYRNVDVWECPPNGQGITALLALNILSGFDVRATDANSAQRWHLMIESLRLAFADARWYVADPRCTTVPMTELLSTHYAARRRSLINTLRANTAPARGTPTSSSDTVYLCAVDEAGNACSFINSNYSGFGTGLVPPGCGFTLQNRGHNFSLEPGHPNAIAPHKRPYHTIIPGMLTRAADRSLLAPFGVMGGFMQPQGHLQVVVSLVDDGLDPQAALDQPRFCITDGASGGDVALEAGTPLQTIAGLETFGHTTRSVHGYSRSLFGRGQIIVRQPDGVLWGGSDPRADGCAQGLE